MNRQDRVYILKQTDLDQISRLIALCREGIYDIFYQNCVYPQPYTAINDNYPTAEERLKKEIALSHTQPKT